jgi:hypothetical protein
LANLSALEKVRAVQTRAKQEMSFEQGAAIFENLDDFVVLNTHAAQFAVD